MELVSIKRRTEATNVLPIVPHHAAQLPQVSQKLSRSMKSAELKTGRKKAREKWGVIVYIRHFLNGSYSTL